MRKKDFINIKTFDIPSLLKMAEDKKDQLVDLVIDKNMKKLKDLKSVSKIKKDIAQILTLVRQKELLQELESKVENQESSDKQEGSETSVKSKEERVK